MKEYALYKGDKLLIIGTIDEIAKNQNIQKKTIYFNKPYGTLTTLCIPIFKEKKKITYR